MNIPLSIVMDELAAYKPESYVRECSVAFPVVNIFPSRPHTLHSDHLYIGKLSDIFSADWRSPEIHCIAVRDRIHDEDETPDRMENIVVLNSNCDPLDVFTAIQSCFFRIIEWNERMKDYIIQNRSMQDILLLSEAVIGNYITVSDSSLGLMAYTSGLSVDCPVTNALVANGYHNDETLALFKKHRLPEIWATKGGIYLNDSRTISPYPNLCKVVRYDNSYFAHVIMICNNRAPSDGLTALFAMLLDHLMVCFERQWHDEGSTMHVYDSLISSLIEDELSPDIIAERATHSGLLMYGDFHFLKISPDNKTSVMLRRMGQDILWHMPESKVTIHKSCLLVLVVHHSEPGEWLDSSEHMLDQLMERYGAQCGISTHFHSLTDLRFAHEQADIALKFGPYQSLRPFSGRARLRSPRLHAYEDHYPCYLMCGTMESARLARSTRASAALMTLYNYDLQHGTNNLELLFAYLNNDRKATETASYMHMHRNNVIYRINRICEMASLDLDDPNVRFRLLLAYEIFSPTEMA